jgi:hypothetical protein
MGLFLMMVPPKIQKGGFQKASHWVDCFVYVLQHTFYLRNKIQNVSKNFNVGRTGCVQDSIMWIVLESTHQNMPLVAIGYRYSTRKIFFAAAKDAGATAKGNLYELKYTEDWGNAHVCNVVRPDIVSKFLERSNIIDKHNQVRVI